MSDVPQTPGGFPGPFDLNKIMRMLQSPGPVNMEVARETAESMANVDVETGEQRVEPPLDPDAARAFDDVVRAVQLMVMEATGISGTLTVPIRTVDRATWASVTLTGLEPVLAALAGALGRTDADPDATTDPAAAAAFSPDMLFAMMMPLLLGGWAGSMIGLLAHRALGQYDLPLPLDGPPTLLFAARNVDAFAEEWSLPVDELRYALALREVVHGAQRSVPWVRERLLRCASAYVNAYEVQTEAMESQFGGLDPSDPSSMEAIARLADPDVLLGAMRSERQAPLLAELQRFVSVLEGYTDVVVEALGERMVTAHGRLDEALRRHRLERGDATGFVDRLLGLELDRGHYETCVAYCRGVMERSAGSFDQLNRLWSHESMVPTEAELVAPGLWLARIDLHDTP
ncbi:MAG: putative hydrolase [Actinomycetia bacterium]|nr:putative hydrolase [Actinomycetes bacterium]